MQPRRYDVQSPSYLLSDSLQSKFATFAVGNGRSFRGPGCVACSLHSVHSLAQTGALCSVQVTRGLLRGRVSRAVSRQCNSGRGSGPGSDSPHRLHSRTQLQLELYGNQRQSGNANIWAYLYHSVLVARFDGKHHYPFFLPWSVLKW